MISPVPWGIGGVSPQQAAHSSAHGAGERSVTQSRDAERDGIALLVLIWSRKVSRPVVTDGPTLCVGTRPAGIRQHRAFDAERSR